MVSVWGNTICVGAKREDSNATGVDGAGNNNAISGAGAAYVFARSGTSWSPQGYSTASNTGGVDDWFGDSESVSGDTIVVGAPAEDRDATGEKGDGNNNAAEGAGAVYLFVRRASAWSQAAYLKASTPQAGRQFGNDVALSGDLLVAGTMGDDSDATGIDGDEDNNGAPSSGAAHVFDLDAEDPFPAQCFGATCPCGNDSANGGGCDNSLPGTGGAILSASGTASLANDTLVLSSTNTMNQPGIYFQANTFLVPPSFGDGLRCCGVDVVRCGTYLPSGNATNTGTGNLIGGNPPPLSDIGPNASLSPGDVRCYPWWYRDPSGPCTTGFNLSNSISVTWGA